MSAGTALASDGFEQDLPEETEAAVQLAWENECEYIRYDCDGPVVDLPVYVW